MILTIGGNVQKLAQNINTIFHSVSSDLSSLDISPVPDLDADILPDVYIIEPYQVE